MKQVYRTHNVIKECDLWIWKIWEDDRFSWEVNAFVYGFAGLKARAQCNRGAFCLTLIIIVVFWDSRPLDWRDIKAVSLDKFTMVCHNLKDLGLEENYLYILPIFNTHSLSFFHKILWILITRLICPCILSLDSSDRTPKTKIHFHD